MEQFVYKAVYSVDANSNILDHNIHKIWCKKVPDYVISLMSTGGALRKEGGQ